MALNTLVSRERCEKARCFSPAGSVIKASVTPIKPNVNLGCFGQVKCKMRVVCSVPSRFAYISKLMCTSDMQDREHLWPRWPSPWGWSSDIWEIPFRLPQGHFCYYGIDRQASESWQTAWKLDCSGEAKKVKRVDEKSFLSCRKLIFTQSWWGMNTI